MTQPSLVSGHVGVCLPKRLRFIPSITRFVSHGDSSASKRLGGTKFGCFPSHRIDLQNATTHLMGIVYLFS